MNKLEEMMQEFEMMPVDLRIQLAQRLLQGTQPTDPNCDEAWLKLAQQRLDELDSGEAEGIPWEDVREEARRRARNED